MIDEILGEQKEQLDADFVPNYRRVGPNTMGRKTDGLNRLGTTSNQEGKDFEKEEEAVREGLGDESRWPEPGATAPYVTSGNWTHSILHPIENEAAAEIIPPMVPLQLDLLRCKEHELRLLNQNCEWAALFPATDIFEPEREAAAQSGALTARRRRGARAPPSNRPGTCAHPCPRPIVSALLQRVAP